MQSAKRNPWKLAVIASTALAATGIVIASAIDRLPAGENEAAVAADPSGQPAAAQARPAAQPAPQATAPVEDCSRYLAATDRDEKHIVRDGVLGAAIGAGVGAAGGAIADGGEGAGKGAGIGAVAGVAGGALYGLNQENQRTQAARNAYQDCLARNR